jgi:hypothetical protein
MSAKQNRLKSFAVIGHKGESLSTGVIETCKLQKELRRLKKIGQPHEVKLKFKAPNSRIAAVVADLNDGWIENIDDYIQDLADFYGYSVSKPRMPPQTKRRTTKYLVIGNKGESRAHWLTGKLRKRYLNFMEKFEGCAQEVKLEFQAPSGEMARTVYDVFNGFIEIDRFIRDLAYHYGYSIRRVKPIRRRETRRT